MLQPLLDLRNRVAQRPDYVNDMTIAAFKAYMDEITGLTTKGNAPLTETVRKWNEGLDRHELDRLHSPNRN